MNQGSKTTGRFIFAVVTSLVILLVLFAITEKKQAFDEYSKSAVTEPTRVVNAVFQQDVDHFSNDERAMSPRDWGQYDADTNVEPQPPKTVYDQTPNERIQERRQIVETDNSKILQIESPRVREPKSFYETEPLEASANGESNGEFASPVPPDIHLQDQEQVDKKSPSVPTELPNESAEDSKQQDEHSENETGRSPDNAQDEKLGSRVEANKGSDQTKPAEIKETPQSDLPLFQPQFDGSNFPQDYFTPNGSAPRLGAYIEQQPTRLAPNRRCACCCQHGQNIKPFRMFGSRAGRKGQSSTADSCGRQSQCADCYLPPKYNEHLGHRYEDPISRGFQGSSAEKFSFEEDGEFPPASEMLANSVFFSEFEFSFLQPSFQGNTAISENSPGGGASNPFNFDLEPAFRIMAGFESDYGPGFAGEYFQFDNNSDTANFVSDGVTTGETRVYQLGPNRWTSLIADDPGESIDTFHSIEVHSTSVYAFKAIKFKRAYVNGRFGIQIATVDQKLHANLFDAGGNRIGRLNHFSNLNAFGPRFGIDYVRKIGHTPAQLVTSATTSLLFGDRDQTVENTFTGDFDRIGADEFLAVFDIFFGVQGKQIRGEKRNTTFRLGFVNQTWLGGGTAIDPNGDFGFQGISMMLGFNR